MACIVKRRGRWVIDFYDQHGKRRWKTMPEDTIKKKARDELRAIEAMVDNKTYIPIKAVPLFSEVGKDWIKQKEHNVRASTLKMYRNHLKYHFEDINELKVNRITVAKVEEFITDKQSERLNLTTLRKIIVTFNQVMNYAVRHRYIDHNPVRDAERPRGQGEISESPIRILNALEINAFLDAVSEQEYKTLFKLAIMSGARQGELFGLKWSDIDWSNNQIHIKRSWNSGAWYQPKSRTSNRKIDIGPTMMKELKKWKLACPKNDLDLVFPNDAGGPMDHGNVLRRHFYPALKASGLPQIRFHDLRHTYASLLIEQGENIKYIQSQLGHASPTVTLNVYAHLMNHVNQEAACRLEDTLFKTTGSKMVANENAQEKRVN